MKHHDLALSRRTVLGAAAAASLAGIPAWAQDKAPIQFATLLDFTRVYTFLTDEYSQGQQDRWIPASGGARPNIGDEILILRQRIADTHIAYIIRYLTTEDIDERTTHWMPLPPNPEQRCGSER